MDSCGSINSISLIIAAAFLLSVRSVITLSETKGLEFFNGYGDGTMAKWEAFKTSVNGVGKDETTQDKVIEDANNTFSKFKDWIEKN